MPRSHEVVVSFGPAAALLLAGCGAGVVAVAASAGGDDSGSVPPSIAAFTVENPRQPDLTRVRFSLPRRASVELFYQVPPAAPRPMRHADKPAGELDPGSHSIRWCFAEELDLDASFHPAVLVFALIPGVVDEPREGENALTLGLGNDRPVVAFVEPIPSDPLDPAESAGNVEIQLGISDSSSDPVDITVQWQSASAPPDDWSDATAAGIQPTGVETTPGGVELSFFWNTNVDLHDEEDTVLFRVTADDRTESSDPFVTTVPFRVDNNEGPIVQLDSGPIRSNPDERRGLPIPFRVIDAEGDMVETTFQWRRRDEAFPQLPNDRAELEALLLDPAQRALRHVCTEYPTFARGRVEVVPGNDSAVRLPELASGEAWFLHAGVVDQTLELLRPSHFPGAIAPYPGASPVAALPMGDGLTALVLEEGRLLVLELATGEVELEIALEPGVPSAMALERGTERIALVASTDPGGWRLDRVELVRGALPVPLALADSTLPPPVHGLASLGSKRAILTVDSALVTIDYSDSQSVRVSSVLESLSGARGIALDPRNEGRLYVAERNHPGGTGPGRILAIDLDTHVLTPMCVDPAPLALEHPEVLALEHGGTRLLAVMSTPEGRRQVVGLELGRRACSVPVALGEPLEGEIASLASGPDELRLLVSVALSGDRELLAGGGLEQRRVIRAFEPEELTDVDRRQLAVLDAPLAPTARLGQPWRIPYGSLRRATPSGLPSTFVWDSTEARGGEVLLRALPRDAEIGTAAEGAAPKQLRAPLDVEPLVLGSPTPDGANSVAAADFDGDGHLDLVSANLAGDDLTAFYQGAQGNFDTGLAFGGSTLTDDPRCVAAADLDGDGSMDVATANFAGNSVTVFRGDSTGSFALDPSTPLDGAPTITNGPSSIVAADIDDDGQLDLIVANERSRKLAVFRRTGGTYPEPPQTVLAVSGPASKHLAVAATDLNGDGRLDLVAANQSHGRLTAFFQLAEPQPPGTFNTTSPLILQPREGAYGPSAVAAADLDADGDVDLLSANEEPGNLIVFFLEARDFVSRKLGDAHINNFVRAVDAADLDADGDLDLVSASQASHTLSAFFQTTPGIFAQDALVLRPDPTGGRSAPVSLVAEDLDGDGDQDLVSANEEIDALTVFFQDSAGNPFATAEILDVSMPNAAAAADLDGDGDRDLVSATGASNNFIVAMFLQESPGAFSARNEVPDVEPRPISVVASDLDGDGDQDLLTANRFGNNLTIYERGSQTGAFAKSRSLGGAATTSNPAFAIAADLDGNGLMDVLSANKGGDDLAIFLQEPEGFLEAPLFLGDSGVTKAPSFVAAADLDDDGDQDIISANSAGKDLAVFHREETGEFSIRSLAGLAAPVSVATSDLDGDGDLDIVSANNTGDDLTIFFQVSPRNFVARLPPLGGPGSTNAPASVSVADLDTDGDPDIVSANTGSGDLTIFFQEVAGRFGPAFEAVTVRDPVFVLASDLDGDADQDLVAVRSSGGLAIFWGGR